MGSEVLTDWCCEIDTSQNAQVEYRHPISSLMNEPNIGNTSRHQRLQRRHAKALDNSRSHQANVTLRSSRPEASQHQSQSSDKIHRPLAISHSKRIPYDGTKSNGYDHTSLDSLDEIGQSDIEVFSKANKRRTEQRSDSYDWQSA